MACRIVACLLAVVLFSPPALASQTAPGTDSRTDTSNYALSRQVLEAAQVGAVALGAIENSLALQRAANTRLPAAFWDEFLAEAKRSMPELVEGFAPVYAERFSAAELNQLLAFYRSSIGQRLAAEQPALTQAGARLGQVWGAEIGARVVKTLTDRGVQLQ